MTDDHTLHRYISKPEIEAIARKGLFEGALTTEDLQKLCAAVMAQITTDRDRYRVTSTLRVDRPL